MAAVVTFELAGRAYAGTWWAGERLASSADAPLSFDLETEAMRPAWPAAAGEDPAAVPPDPLHVPRPALGMAYDGDRLVLVHPDRLPAFVRVHRQSHWVGHNLQFDWWVLHRHGPPDVRRYLWSLGSANRLADTMVLDLLLQLATGRYRHVGALRAGDEIRLFPANLGVLAAEHGAGELDKESPYRLRFGELIGLSEAAVGAHPEAAGFLRYALADAVATWEVYRRQRPAAVALMRRAGWSPDPGRRAYEIRPDALAAFGALGEYVQVRASITLAELSRTPVPVDRARRAEVEAGARERYAAALAVLEAAAPTLVRRYRAARFGGRPRMTARALIPQMDSRVLTATLLAEAARLGVTAPISPGKERRVSLSAKAWAHLADRSPFVAAWVALEREAKSLEFLAALGADAVYTRYALLTRTGRTAAGAHRAGRRSLVPSLNLQQIPREDPAAPGRSLRRLFRPPPGHVWLACDYSYVEIRSLAAVCRARFGASAVADAVDEHTRRGGLDPHERMAVTLLGTTPEGYRALPPAARKEARQRAKACMFGYPGGLGVRTFRAYARQAYGVEFTPAQAKAAKAAWLRTYPEMTAYLADRTEDAIRWQSGGRVSVRLGWLGRKRLADFLRGLVEPGEEEADGMWSLLGRVARAAGDAAAAADVAARQVTPAVRRLVTYRACTLTGRVRDNVRFTDGANTPFQGAAADGAKEALWDLLRAGWRVALFVHDEVGVFVPRAAAARARREVPAVMAAAMERVLGHRVPVAVDAAVADWWAKG